MAAPDTTTLLLILALLFVLLLAAVRNRNEGERQRRHTPLSPDELGRYIYAAAQTRDGEAWRDLFVLGAEAGRVFGENAREYLTRMTPDHRLRGLATVISAIPQQAVYQGTRVEASGLCRLQVRSSDGSVADIPVGRVVQVGAAWRIQDVAPSSR